MSRGHKGFFGDGFESIIWIIIILFLISVFFDD